MLRERNEKYNGAIKFVDISADEYDADANNGIDFETVIWRMMLHISYHPISNKGHNYAANLYLLFAVFLRCELACHWTNDKRGFQTF